MRKIRRGAATAVRWFGYSLFFCAAISGVLLFELARCVDGEEIDFNPM